MTYTQAALALDAAPRHPPDDLIARIRHPRGMVGGVATYPDPFGTAVA